MTRRQIVPIVIENPRQVDTVIFNRKRVERRYDAVDNPGVAARGNGTSNKAHLIVRFCD